MIDTTNSVYDLLPKEDLEALRWMRGQGGLDVVRMHAELFQQLKEERNGYRDLAREYEKRLMPEGYEWPRYDTGEPVLITDVVVGQDYGEHLEVSSIEFHANGFTIHDRTGFSKWYESDAWFERPAIIAADGEPLEVGQTVWGIGRFQHKFEVLALNDIDPEIGSRFNVKCFNRNENKKCWCDPSLLTHQRPVLDADGSPLKAGQTVWVEQNGDGPYIIDADGVRSTSDFVDCHFKDNENERLRIRADLITGRPPVRDANDVLIRPGDVVYANATSRGDGTAWRVVRLDPKRAHSVHAEREHGRAVRRDLVPAWLTHEPDTWERIEEDAANLDEMPCPFTAKDLVRRCKRVAERGE